MISTKGKFLISREAIRHPHARVVRWYRLHLLMVWRAFVWVSNNGHLFNINESIWKTKMYFYMWLVINLILVTLRSTRQEVQCHPSSQRKFWKGDFCYDAETFRTCSFIHRRLFLICMMSVHNDWCFQGNHLITCVSCKKLIVLT